jgi:hypothetical protein
LKAKITRECFQVMEKCVLSNFQYYKWMLWE